MIEDRLDLDNKEDKAKFEMRLVEQHLAEIKDIFYIIREENADFSALF